MRILIANRGRSPAIIRTAKRLGHETVAVYADPDAAAPFVADADHAVRIGPASLPESYLSIERLLAACADTGADAVHPGYGFLSENADFARPSSTPVWSGSGPSPTQSPPWGPRSKRVASLPKPGCRSSRASLTPGA